MARFLEREADIKALARNIISGLITETEARENIQLIQEVSRFEVS